MESERVRDFMSSMDASLHRIENALHELIELLKPKPLGLGARRPEENPCSEHPLQNDARNRSLVNELSGPEQCPNTTAFLSGENTGCDGTNCPVHSHGRAPVDPSAGCPDCKPVVSLPGVNTGYWFVCDKHRSGDTALSEAEKLSDEP